MKNYIFTIFFVILACICKSDSLYFWLADDDLRYNDLIESDDYDVKAYVIDGESKNSLGVSRGKGNGWWKYDSTTKSYVYTVENLTVGDFAHDESTTANGRDTVVYRIDTGDYKLNKSDAYDYSFLIEIDNADGTALYATILESDVWQGRYYKDHICDPIEVAHAEIPEPSTSLLSIFGLSLLMLRRRQG